MLPQPIIRPSPLLVFQEMQHQSLFGMLPPSPYGGMLVPPLPSTKGMDSLSSISTKKMRSIPKKAHVPVDARIGVASVGPTVGVAIVHRKAKKSVRWGSAYTYTSKLRNPEDISQMWYNSSDLEQFQREKRKIIRALKHVKGDLTALEGTKYVTRGFECYQSVPFNRRIRNQRQEVVRQVLQLQAMQKKEKQQEEGAVVVHVDIDEKREHEHGMQSITTTTTTTTSSSDSNSEALANVARHKSAWARDLAFQLGQKDAVEMGWKEFFSVESTTTTTGMDASDSDGSDENMEHEKLCCISQVFAHPWESTTKTTIVPAAAAATC